MHNQVVILIPAYKPTAELVTLCKSLSDFQIVCVDDGSGQEYDGIFSEAARYSTVLRYEINRGKGVALKHGIRHIAESPDYSSYSYILTADADGQHKPDDILRVAAKICDTGGFVLGVRRFCGNVPIRSRFGNIMTKAVFHLASGKSISDTQTGLRAFEIKHADLWLNTHGERYEYEMNVLFTAVEAEEDKKLSISEVEIETVYENDNKGSHFRPIRDSYRIYKRIFIASRTRKRHKK